MPKYNQFMQMPDSTIITKLMHIYEAVRLGNSFQSYDPLEPGKPISNPLNIGYGSAGRALFAFELYKYTGDNSILRDLNSYLCGLDKYLKEHKSNNYSLFNGRAGAGWLFIEYFKLTHDERFLESAIHIPEEQYNKNRGQGNFFDKCSLFDGIAGMLLFFIALYDLIKKDWLLQHIEQYTLFLIAKAGLTASGVYWMNDSRDLNIASNWPQGNSGIAFCLLEAGSYFNNDSLYSLAYSTLVGNADLQLQQKALTGAFTERAISQNLVWLYATHQTNATQYMGLKHNPAVFYEPSSNEGSSFGIYDGLAGNGLALKEAYCITQNIEYLEAANKISQTLSNELERKINSGLKNPDFFHGLSGVGYAILKIAGVQETPSLMLPRLFHDAMSLQEKRVAVQINANTGTINKLLIETNFKDTYAHLKREFQHQLYAVLPTASFVNLKIFREWVSSLGEENTADPMKETIIETIDREIAGQQLRCMYAQSGVERNIELAKKIEQISALSKSELKDLNVVISDKLLILRREKFIDLSKPISIGDMQTLLSSYGYKSYFLRIGGFHEIENGRLEINRFYIDQFINPATIDSMVSKIIQFMKSQDDQVTTLLLRAFSVANTDLLEEPLSDSIIGSIKWCLIQGILIVENK
jgi:Lanthionine synthetase C-like protein